MPSYLGEYVDSRWPTDAAELPVNQFLSFAKVITHPSAVFAQENALLQLARALAILPAKVFRKPSVLTPLSIHIRCTKEWKYLLNPSENALEVKYVPVKAYDDPLYETPSWCDSRDAWMYALGRLLRSAATGELDFTTRQWLLREDPGWYNGIRSTWQKRRIGMLHTASALGGTTAPITPWLSSLLLVLLRWPGIPADSTPVEFRTLRQVTDFADVVRRRLAHQAALFGKSSNIPIYRYPVEWDLRTNRELRVVVVQGLMPAAKDFAGGLSYLADPRYREKHRNHSAALLHLAHRQLLARNSVLGKDKKSLVDLVIFPEYAIHKDDQDLMRSFSDATGAMLFYGLLGATSPTSGNSINAGRWLIPQRKGGRRSWIEIDQGKWHLTDEEHALKVAPWRPYQVVIELHWNGGQDQEGYRISGSICYDATDLALAADLKDESHMFVVAAMNKDVRTFDSMVAALRYHMYQHVIIANSGEFGGSTAQAPYHLEHKRLIAHVHGSDQMTISVFDINVDDFGPKLNAAKAGVPVLKEVVDRIGKTRPAGLVRSP